MVVAEGVQLIIHRTSDLTRGPAEQHVLACDEAAARCYLRAASSGACEPARDPRYGPTVTL